MIIKKYLRKSTGYLHRHIVETVLGRKLTNKEVVHHVDGDTLNNSNHNLVVCPDDAYHLLLHARQRIQDAGGNPNTDKYCGYHKTIHNKSEFSTKNSTYDGLHNNCRAATNQYRKEKGLNVDKFDWKARLNQQYRRVMKSYTNRQISWLV